MSRGFAILVVFGAVLGAFVVWGPVQISMKSHEPASAPAAATVTNTNENVGQPAAAETPTGPAGTLAPVRKADGAAADRQPRDAVLAATQTLQPSSALAALPERAVPGFPLAPHATITNDQIAAAMKQARSFRGQGQLTDARDLLSNVYLGHRLTKEQRLRLAEELDPIAREILHSQSILDDGQLYQVQPGDTLVKLAKQFKVPPEYIARLNGVANPRKLQRGQTLKFVDGPFDVLVEPNEFELTVLRKGKYVRRFSIGIGKDDTPTPAGLYNVTDKQVEPTKWPDSVDRRTLPPKHPDNPLGTRWLGIGLGYGIHGTIEPQTIGQKASRGCIRMRNHDVEELYDMVTEGSRVLIQ